MTTRTLVLLRHAKAANPPGIDDIDRPLSARGHADAGVAGAWLAQHGFRPDRVLCSTARRTRETWHGVSLALPVAGAPLAEPEVTFERSIYAADPEDILELVQAVDDAATTVLVVGHNPGLSQLCALLDAAADAEGLATAGISVHRHYGSWAGCRPGAARVVAEHTARA